MTGLWHPSFRSWSDCSRTWVHDNILSTVNRMLIRWLHFRLWWREFRWCKEPLLVRTTRIRRTNCLWKGWGGGTARASLRFEKRLNFSIFDRYFSNRSEALGTALLFKSVTVSSSHFRYHYGEVMGKIGIVGLKTKSNHIMEVGEGGGSS